MIAWEQAHVNDNGAAEGRLPGWTPNLRHGGQHAAAERPRTERAAPS